MHARGSAEHTLEAKQILYVVEPTFYGEDDDTDNWEGKISYMQKLITRVFKSLKVDFQFLKNDLLESSEQ